MRQFTLLYEDADFIAVDKPPHLAVIPGRGETDNVQALLSAELNCKLLVVHRLDKDTTGVLLFARHRDAQRHLSHQFQNNTVKKEYLALVAGKPGENEGEIDASIGPHPTVKQRMSILKRGGRPARTSWKLEQTFRDFALLRVFPKTGKTHQIRVHLLHIGLPLAVDPLYHSDAGPIYLSHLKRGYKTKQGEPERPLIDRLTLHAQRIEFQHLDGRQIVVESPLPKDFRTILNQLNRLFR